MININNNKKKDILEFLNQNIGKSFTLNQIRILFHIHIYKAEVLMTELLLENKVLREEKGKFIFWGIK